MSREREIGMVARYTDKLRAYLAKISKEVMTIAGVRPPGYSKRLCVCVCVNVFMCVCIILQFCLLSFSEPHSDVSCI